MLRGSVTDDSGEQASDTIIEAFFLVALKFKNHETENQAWGGDTVDYILTWHWFRKSHTLKAHDEFPLTSAKPD